MDCWTHESIYSICNRKVKCYDVEIQWCARLRHTNLIALITIHPNYRIDEIPNSATSTTNFTQMPENLKNEYVVFWRHWFDDTISTYFSFFMAVSPFLGPGVPINNSYRLHMRYTEKYCKIIGGKYDRKFWRCLKLMKTNQNIQSRYRI